MHGLPRVPKGVNVEAREAVRQTPAYCFHSCHTPGAGQRSLPTSEEEHRAQGAIFGKQRPKKVTWDAMYVRVRPFFNPTWMVISQRSRFQGAGGE